MRVLLADDHAVLRDGLCAVLERRGIDVVGTASTGRDAVAFARRLSPDVVVMDVSMPDLNGIEAARQITREIPTTRVVGLSMHSDRRYVVAMLAAGARGYLLKESAAAEVVAALEAVMQGRTYVSEGIAGTLVETLQQGAPMLRVLALTGREREVLQLLAEGMTSKEIGARLHIAVPTVETHRRQIMAKLGLRTIAELTKLAVREGLTSLEK